MISLETYTRSQLQHLIDSEKYATFPFCPITKHRALSHIHNPRASESDTLLILIFYEGVLAGYMGILPDEMDSNGNISKIGWLSTLYVDPQYRGKRLGQLLLAKAFEEYKNYIIITEFTPEAEAMYLKSKLFTSKVSMIGTTFYYHSNLKNILPTKNNKWSRISFVLKPVDVILNLFQNIKYNFISSDENTYQLIDKLDEESKIFIENIDKNGTFKRKNRELEWVSNYPWIKESADKINLNYQFSSYAREFKFSFIKVYDKSKLIAVLMISVRDKTAKLLYSFATDHQKAAKAVHHFMITNKIINLISFDDGINECLHNQSYLFKKERKRQFMYHADLKNKLGKNENIEFKGGDGDTLFT